MKLEAEGPEFTKILWSLEQFIQTVKGQNNFWQQNVFLICSWIKKYAGIVRKINFLCKNEFEFVFARKKTV